MKDFITIKEQKPSEGMELLITRVKVMEYLGQHILFSMFYKWSIRLSNIMLNRWLFVIIFIGFCYSLTAQDLSIQGKIESSRDQQVFIEYSGETKVITDSTLSKNGYFTFSVNKSSDQQFTVKLDKGQSFEFFYTFPVTKLVIKSPIDQSNVINPSEDQLDLIKHE